MNEIDHLFADYCPRVPAASHGEAERVAIEAVAGVRPPIRRSRRSWRPAAVAGLSVAAVAGLAAVAVILPHQRSAPVAADAPRVDWGMDAVIEVTPDPAVSAEDAQERVTKAIMNRASQRDAAGLEITPIDARRLRLRAPGAESQQQIASFVRFDRLEVVDMSSDVIASAPDLRGLAPAARRLITPGVKTVFYAQQDGGPGLGLAGPERVRTRAAAERIRRTRAPGRVDILEVPADTRVLTIGTERDLLVRARGESMRLGVADIAADANAFRVTLDTATTPPTGTPVLVSVLWPGAVPEVLGTGTVAADGSVTTPSERAAIRIGQFASPDPGGVIRVIDATPYGPRPTIVGRSFTVPDHLPPPFRAVRWPSGLTWTTVFEAGSGRAHRQVVAGHRGNRIDAFAVGIGTNPVVPTTSGPNLCRAGIGAPRLVVCDGTGSGSDIRKPRVTMRYRQFGRVRDEVSRITMDVAPGGAPQTAIIRNGWFFVEAATTIDNPDFRNPRAMGPNERFRPRLRAWDRSGVEVPVTSGYSDG